MLRLKRRKEEKIEEEIYPRFSLEFYSVSYKLIERSKKLSKIDGIERISIEEIFENLDVVFGRKYIKNENWVGYPQNSNSYVEVSLPRNDERRKNAYLIVLLYNLSSLELNFELNYDSNLVRIYPKDKVFENKDLERIYNSIGSMNASLAAEGWEFEDIQDENDLLGIYKGVRLVLKK